LTASAASLVVIRRDGSEGERYPVGESVDLGRGEGDVRFDDPYLSPRHCRLVSKGGGFFLRDLDSANGVYIRIPFWPRAARRGDDARHAAAPSTRSSPDEGGPGHHAAADAPTHQGSADHGEDRLTDPRDEQPLSEEELFLVGQQVLRFEVVNQAEEGFGAASEHGTLLFGTPAGARYARLSQRTTEGVAREVFYLHKAETVIGRESGDIVFTDDPFLSRRHAVIRMQGGAGEPKRFTLADLGSSNGTFLRIRDEVRLQRGDHFRIGQQLLRFDIDAARGGV
jgi:pSer/pThr/pTyr-binding forkhead associated (FHA) protein